MFMSLEEAIVLVKNSKLDFTNAVFEDRVLKKA